MSSDQTLSETAADPLTNPPAETKNQAVLFLLLGIIFGLVAALGGYFLSSDKPWLRRQMTEFLNFQITLTIVGLIALALNATIILAVIGIPLLIFVGLWNLVLLIIGASKASKGEFYKYPATLRLLS